MRTKIIHKVIILLSLIALFSSCGEPEDYFWKYSKEPRALFVEMKQRLTDKLFVIKDLKSDSLGYYINK